jgi:hypothetical protein
MTDGVEFSWLTVPSGASVALPDAAQAVAASAAADRVADRQPRRRRCDHVPGKQGIRWLMVSPSSDLRAEHRVLGRSNLYESRERENVQVSLQASFTDARLVRDGDENPTWRVSM